MLKYIVLGAALLSNLSFAQIGPVESGKTISAAKLNEIIEQINELKSQVTPIGSVIAMAGACPERYKEANGESLPKSNYPSLFNVIGAAHGGNTTNFNLPDYRGRFLRGVDGGAGRDPDRAARVASNSGGASGDSVGSVQNDMLGQHRHSLGGTGDYTLRGGTTTIGNHYVSPSWSGYEGGNETRPKNANVRYCIRVQ